jgi:uncharacterized membrane protein YfcA
MAEVFVWLVLLAAALAQSLIGFGVALIAMPLLVGLLGLRVASPLVALVALTLEGALLLRYRTALNLGAVKQLAAGQLVGVPLGVALLGRVPETVLVPALGGVVIAYALYALSGRRLPELRGAGWGLGLGALAGVLSGAYNTGGPPVIVYADSRRWSPAEFKGNLQGFFLVADVLVVAGHALSGNLTPGVWSRYLIALPAIALALVAGALLERRLKPKSFRPLVLALLLIMGARLILAALG